MRRPLLCAFENFNGDQDTGHVFRSGFVFVKFWFHTSRNSVLSSAQKEILIMERSSTLVGVL